MNKPAPFTQNERMIAWDFARRMITLPTLEQKRRLAHTIRTCMAHESRKLIEIHVYALATAQQTCALARN